MNNTFQKVDDTLSKALKGLMNVSSIPWGDDRQEFIDALTFYKQHYEDMVVYEFDDECHCETYLKLVNSQSPEVANAYGAAHGKLLSKELSKKFELMFLLSAMGNYQYSQIVADEIYTCIIKKECREHIDSLSKKVYLRENLKEIAKKPRNKYHDQAIQIAKATWHAYPGASMGKLCEKIRIHFHGGVSLDTLERWIKAAKIRPPKPQKYTSFSLVILPPA